MLRLARQLGERVKSEMSELTTLHRLSLLSEGSSAGSDAVYKGGIRNNIVTIHIPWFLPVHVAVVVVFAVHC